MKDRRSPRRVLIVDDEPANVRLLAEALGPGYQTHFATGGSHALELAEQLPIDLVLLDVVMPGLDGFEVLRQLKENEATRPIPVIFVTAMDEVEDEEHGFDLGAVDYITKPVSPPIVRARVRTHIELKEQRDLLEMRASIDGLTGLANRRCFDERLAASLRRRGGLLSLLLLDVDFFKQFNDHYGHAHGDECLKQVAAVLPDVFRRPLDLPARYGGEEFVVLMPDTDAPGARERAGALLSRLAALGLPHERSRVAPHVTLSIGGVTAAPEEADGPEALLKAADQLLYEAKEAGRDRCVHLDLPSGEKRTIRGGENETST